MTLLLLFDGAATGSLVATQAAATLAATGGPVVGGALTATQGNQTLVAAGGPIVGGALTATQGNQTLSGAAGVLVTGALTATQGNQTLIAAAGPIVGGAFTATQGNQTLVAIGGPVVGGAFTATQATDILAATAGAIVGGALTATQGNQTLVGAGSVIAGPVTGVFVGTQANDILAAIAALGPLPPRFNSGTVVIADSAVNRSYGTSPAVGAAFSLIVNLAGYFTLTQTIALKFVAPSGAIQYGNSGYVYVGAQTLQLAERVNPAQYVVYQAGAGEFNEPGTWQVVVLMGGGQSGTYFFTVGAA